MSREYRKKPVVIEAVRWDGSNVLEMYSFMHGAPKLDTAITRDKWDDFSCAHFNKDWHIKTLEDGPNGEAKHVASVGDWIIKGIQGEFYPCKPDIFAATYEEAALSTSAPSVDAEAVERSALRRAEELVRDMFDDDGFPVSNRNRIADAIAALSPDTSARREDREGRK